MRLAEDQHSDDEVQEILAGNSPHSIKLIPFALPGIKKQVLCDTSHNRVRPFITQNLRKRFLHATHDLSHPGRKSTAQLMTERFVWPSIRKDSENFAKNCIACQKTKVQRHNRSAFEQYQPTLERFSDINIAILGPFPPSEGQRYLLTIIDRFTRWPEAIPMPDRLDITFRNSSESLIGPRPPIHVTHF